MFPKELSNVKSTKKILDFTRLFSSLPMFIYLNNTAVKKRTENYVFIPAWPLFFSLGFTPPLSSYSDFKLHFPLWVFHEYILMLAHSGRRTRYFWKQLKYILKFPCSTLLGNHLQNRKLQTWGNMKSHFLTHFSMR